MLPDETLADLVAIYSEVAAETDALVGTVDLDSGHLLPEAPWFPPGQPLDRAPHLAAHPRRDQPARRSR